MALRSLTEEELERARNTRQLNTVLKWRSGKLLRRYELDRIRDVIGEKAHAERLAQIEASLALDRSRVAPNTCTSCALLKNFQTQRAADYALDKSCWLREAGGNAAAQRATRKFLPHFDTPRASVERTLDTHSGQNSGRSLFSLVPIDVGIPRQGEIASFIQERCAERLQRTAKGFFDWDRGSRPNHYGDCVKLILVGWRYSTRERKAPEHEIES